MFKGISEGVKNVGKISFGTLMGQAITMISLPIFTRMYGASIIGGWALFNSVAIIINSFSDFGLTNAIMIEEDENSALKIYKVVSTVVILVSAISGIVAFLYYSFNDNDMNISTFFIAFTISILVFTLQQTQICYTWLNRRKRYDVLMKNPLINNLVVAFFSLVLGLLGFKKYGYYIGLILGQVVTLTHMRRFLPKGIICLDYNEYIMVLKKHKAFIFYQMPSNIILQIKSQLPTLLIKSFFGSAMLGYYSISVRLMNMPITLLANSLGKVFFQKASEISRCKGNVGEFTLKSLQKAMKLAIIPLILMLTIGDLIIVLFFGEDYIVAGNILRIMSFYGLFLFLSMSVNGIAIVINKQKYMMYSGAFQIVGFVSGMWIGAKLFNSIYIGIIGMSLTFIIIQIVYFCSIFKDTKISIMRYLKPLFWGTFLVVSSYAIIRYSLVMLGITNFL